MGDIKREFGGKTALTISPASLANGSGRESTVVDNTTNKFLDALLRAESKLTGAGTGSIDIYVYSALGDTAYTDSATGSDAAFTAANRLNARYLGSLMMSGTAVQRGMWSVAAAFGGILPDKWGIIIINNGGAALDATGGSHVFEFEGTYATAA
jgi:hypothetical protein